jgi:hypothetical protein
MLAVRFWFPRDLPNLHARVAILRHVRANGVSYASLLLQKIDHFESHIAAFTHELH